MPFEHGPGAVLPYIVEIKGGPHLLGNLEVALQHENWGEDASGLMTEDEARRYCELARGIISRNLPVGTIQVPLKEEADRFILGIAVPLNLVKDADHAKKLLGVAFGCLVDRPDIAVLRVANAQALIDDFAQANRAVAWAEAGGDEADADDVQSLEKAEAALMAELVGEHQQD